MIRSKLMYLKDAYLKESRAKILEVTTKGNQTAVILDSTIFYPQGGGQPSDRGNLVGKSGSLKVTSVAYNNGQPLHMGTLTGSLKRGVVVDLTLDWFHRYANMQAHTAGHLLDEAVKEVLPEYHGIEGAHGIGGSFYIKYVGVIDETHKESTQQKLNEIINANETITTRMVSKKQIEDEGIVIPFKLPENKPLRLIQIGQRQPVPDGGTQLKSTGEAWPVTIGSFDYEDGHTLIHYTVHSPSLQPKSHPKATGPLTETAVTNLSLKQFAQAINALHSNLKSESPSPETKLKYLGKKGLLNQLTKKIPQLPTSDRAAAGQLINQAKKEIEHLLSSQKAVSPKLASPASFAARRAGGSKADSWLDVTAPGNLPPIGHLHPITQTIQEIQHIFETIGFTRVRYPEVDYDHYVFESLNMEPGHPARDEWETFFVDLPRHLKMGEVVLTTHTSNGQVREMERVGKPPIRMLNIAKCYRRQEDVTHTAMFHQFEGLVVDKGISIQHLKGTIDYFAHKMYGPDIKSRLRPFNFKFTEPSFEVDIMCTICRGTTKLPNGTVCKVCKGGWLEVAGSGMVHPNVLKAGGIDPEEYSGWAFGMGVERVLMLKPGLLLDDIRPLYGNNIEFLEQF